MKTQTENTNCCQNIFMYTGEKERTAAFTRLWVEVINRKESSMVTGISPNMVLQAKIS